MNKTYFLILVITLSIILVNLPLVIAPSSNTDYVNSAGYTKGSSGCLSLWTANQIGCSGANASESWFCDSGGYWWTKKCEEGGCDSASGKCKLYITLYVEKGLGTICVKRTGKPDECTQAIKAVQFTSTETVTFQAMPAVGYKFDHFEISGGPTTANPITVTITAVGNVFVSAVFTQASTPTPNATPTPTPNATNITSCTKELCGKKNTAAGCWCDSYCAKAGDCCSDYQQICAGGSTNVTPSPTPTPNATPNGTCMGNCGKYSSAFKCQCDKACTKYNDCCPDYNTLCVGNTTITPTSPPTPNATPSGTCTVALCGKKNTAANCWCDSACKSYGDCCSGFDYNVLCTGGGPTPTPSSTCIKELCGKQAPSGCWCDSACKSYGDCCSGFNYNTICK